MWRKIVFALVLAVIIATVFGCGSGDEPCETCDEVQTDELSVSATVSETVVARQLDDGSSTYLTQSGSVIGPLEVSQLLQGLPQDGTSGIEVKLDLSASEDPNSRAWIPIPWTCYGVVLNWHSGYVAGCIKRNLRHININVQNRCSGGMLFDAHACSWWQNGPQFGIYVSGPRTWCGTTRGGYTAVRDTLANALKAVGFSAAVAAAISAATAPVLVPALGL